MAERDDDPITEAIGTVNSDVNSDPALSVAT